MTDPLDRLQDALKRGTPRADPDARDRALRAAMENFSARAQGSAQETRQTGQKRPRGAAAIWTGVTRMLSNLTQPRALMATTALATLALAVVITREVQLDPPTGVPVSVETGAKLAPGDAETRLRTAEPRADDESDMILAEPVFVPPAEEAEVPSGGVPTAADAGIMARRADNRAPSPQAPAVQGLADGIASSDSMVPMERLQEESLILPAPMPEPPLATRPEASTEAYPEAEPNPLKRVVDDPVSTFSIDVDTASYGVVRSSLTNGVMPPREAVRIEEMVNYFSYDYPAPETLDDPFRTSVSVAETPWNPDTRLLHIGIQGYDLPAAERPPLNLVFLIDTSGSMEDPQKLPLLVRSFKLLLDTLGAEDSVAIVTYAGSAGTVLEPTPASETTKILSALDRLSAGGSTAGQAGLQQAYALAEQMSAEDEVSRVILATDGDFNVGLSDPQALEDFIADKRDSGTYLSVLGFGRGNYNDAIMQSLAQTGNGTASYIDTLAEAQKVLVEDVAGALFPIANDVKIQVEFNPAQVSEYRLIGYETRALNREDFNNDAVDAGEIGAGHTVTALYEITPKGSPAERLSDLRYAPAATTDEVNPVRELAFLKLRYKRPGEARSNLIETPIAPGRQDIPASETDFAAAVAGFGLLLRGGTEIAGWSLDDALALASAARGDDPFGYRAEFLQLVRLAKVAR